jgi:hypothetical protein
MAILKKRGRATSPEERAPFSRVAEFDWSCARRPLYYRLANLQTILDQQGYLVLRSQAGGKQQPGDVILVTGGIQTGFEGESIRMKVIALTDYEEWKDQSQKYSGLTPRKPLIDPYRYLRVVVE